MLNIFRRNLNRKILNEKLGHFTIRGQDHCLLYINVLLKSIQQVDIQVLTVWRNTSNPGVSTFTPRTDHI